ncbi:hypothetical protein DXG01_007742 [Tephrocybe rancida]|nr:hypothetical protein DXG01_007742 [Tephrocybe rancida]
MTPYSSSSYGQAYIRSSPGVELEIKRHPSIDDIDEPSSNWHRSYDRASKTNAMPGFKSLFVDPPTIAQPARPVASKSSNSYSTTSTSEPPTPILFADSEDDEQDESDSEGLSFVETDIRSTFFRVSAERGQWRYDPPRPPPQIIYRKSASTSSPPPLSGPKFLERPISEPAPSTGRASASTPPPPPAEAQDQVNTANDVDMDVAPMTPDRLVSPVPLSSKENALYEDEPYVSSPLPPSSPPLSSSLPTSPMMRSISPLSFAPSSPRLPPSSPLSFLDSLPPDEDIDVNMDMDIQTDDEADVLPTQQSEPSLDVKIEPDLTPAPHEEASKHQRQDPENSVSTPATSGALHAFADVPESNSVESPVVLGPAPVAAASPPQEVQDPSQTLQPVPLMSVVTTPVAAEDPESATTMSTEEIFSSGAGVSTPCGDAGDIDIDIDVAVIAVAAELFADELGPAPLVSSGSAVSKGKARERDVEALRTKDENGVKEHTKLRKQKRKEVATEAEPPRKKLKVKKGEGSGASVEVERKKKRKEGKRRLEEDTEDDENNKPAPRPKKAKKSEGDVSQKRAARPELSSNPSSSTSSASTSKSKSKPVHVSNSETTPSNDAKATPKPPPDDDPQAAELRGMLIETFATSRASCLPASALHARLLEARPALTSTHPLSRIEHALCAGEGGVFGKVESSFRDEAGAPVEARWFYVPEMDEDEERAALVRSMMPRPAKRSETKKYKQYYYRPLAKISRWDPEDDL